MWKSTKQLSLIAFLALILVGVQALQNSPLHDHNHDLVDCALCHLSFSDYGSVDGDSLVHFEAAQGTYKEFSAPFWYSHLYTPYRGRAPPVFSS